jgi:hypothetical protein
MKYKLIINEMLVAYRVIISFRGGCIYERVVGMAVRIWCLLNRWSNYYVNTF